MSNNAGWFHPTGAKPLQFWDPPDKTQISATTTQLFNLMGRQLGFGAIDPTRVHTNEFRQVPIYDRCGLPHRRHWVADYRALLQVPYDWRTRLSLPSATIDEKQWKPVVP